VFGFRSLRTKTILSALIPTALVMVAVGVIALHAYERAARDLLQQRDAELARISAARLSEALGQYSRILQQVAAGEALQSMELARLRSALEEARNQLYVFDGGVVVYDREGIALWSQPFAEGRRGADFPLPSEFDRVRRTLQPVFSDVFSDPLSGEEVILAAVPIVGEGGEFKGVLSGMFRMKYPLLGAIYAEVLRLKVGRSGYAYLVDGNGRVIYHPDGAQVGRNLKATEPVMQALKGEIGATLTRDATGETILSGFAPVPGTGWALITQQRWADVVGPIRAYDKLLLGLLVAGGLLAGGLIFLAIGRTLKPIKDLTHGAQRIAAGDFDHTIAAETGDELEALARQFNTMARALRESYRDLERKVAARTRELSTLNAILSTIAGASELLEMDAVLEDTIAKLYELLDLDAAAILLLDPRRGCLELAASRGLSSRFAQGEAAVRVGECLCGLVAQSERPLVIEDLAAAEGLTRKACMEEDLRSLAVIPLLSRERLMGVLVAGSRTARRFISSEVELLTSMGHHLAIAVENARLYEQAQRVAVSEERERLARELHDSVTQSLYSVTLFAEAARRLAAAKELGRTENYLQQLGQTAQQALKEMRLLVYELRPSKLEEEGLVKALQQRLSTVEQRAGVEARLLVEGEIDLPKGVEEGLYRIAQEALNNALKHAKATSVTVHIRRQGGAVELEIADDGIGFDPEAVNNGGGMGLVSMRERAERLGGTLQIDSRPGEGTKVKVRVQVKSD